MNYKFPRELGLLLLFSLVGMISFFWVCDDAFISFRYSKNLANHGLLKFNTDAVVPIEGYSNFLWVLIAAFFEDKGVPAPVAMPILSMFCALYLLVRIWNILEHDIGLERIWCSTLLLALISFPPFLVWSSSGLATMPFALAFFLLFEYLLGKREQMSIALVVAASISAAWLRVEGICWVVVLVFLCLVFHSSRRIKALAVVLLPAVAAVALQVVFRHWYYGEYLPNTVHAKVGFSAELAGRGASYVAVFLLTYISPLVVFLVGLIELVRTRSRELFLAIAVFFGLYLYAVLVGGDFMSMGRFLVPSFGLQIVILGFVLRTLLTREKGNVVAVFLVGAMVIPSILTTADTYVVPQSVRARFHFRLNKSRFVDEMDHWRFMVKNSIRWGELGRALGKNTKAGETLVAGAIGNIGYYSELQILDRYGLVTRLNKGKKKRLRSPGHDARVGERYFLSSKPTYLRAKLKPISRLSEIVQQRKKTPYPYAPVVFRTDARTSAGEEKVLILMKRMRESEDYERAWRSLEEGWV